MDNRKSTKRLRNSKKSSSPSNKRHRNNRSSPATKRTNRTSSANLNKNLHEQLQKWNLGPYGYYGVQYGPLFAQLSYKPKIQGFKTPRYSMNTQPSAIIVKSLEIPDESIRRKGYGRKFMEAMFKYGNRAKENIILELTITPNSQGLAKALKRTVNKRKMVDDPIAFFF
eukprot:1972228-Pleurochrysis_carterae.AAC.1